MLPITIDSLRLFLHVLGATIWVGGQLAMLYLLSTLRAISDDATNKVVNRFNSLAWGGFVLLVITGIWHLLVVNVGARTVEYQVTLAIKILVVTLSGVGVAAHIIGKSKLALAVGGTLGVVGALAALLFGIVLHG